MRRMISVVWILALMLMASLSLAQAPVIEPVGEDIPDDFRISWPPPVYTLSGTVDVRGSTALVNMANYFLEFRALDPEADPEVENEEPWFPASLPSSSPVLDNVLGQWNTSTATDGLYELRLTANINGEGPRFFRVSPLRIENEPPPFVQVQQPSLRPTLGPTPTQLTGNTGGSPVLRPTLAATPTDFSSSPRVTALTDSNVRRGDNTSYDVVGSLLTGESANVLGVSSSGSGWLYIELPNGRRGFIAPSIVRVEGNTVGLQSITPPATPTPSATPTPVAVANLQPTGLSLDPAAPRCNEAFTIFVNVANTGTGPTNGEFTVRVTNTHIGSGNQTDSTFATVPVLQPGANFVSVLRLTVSTFFEEEHRLTITVDANNQVPETNENDNVAIRNYTLTRAGC